MKLFTSLFIFILFIGCSTSPLSQPSDRNPAQDRGSKALGPLANPDLAKLANQLCYVVDISQGTKGLCLKRFNDFYKSSFDKNAVPIEWLDIVTLSCETIPLKEDTSSYYDARRSCFRNAFHLGPFLHEKISSKSCDQVEDRRAGGDCYKKLILHELGISTKIEDPSVAQ